MQCSLESTNKHSKPPHSEADGAGVDNMNGVEPPDRHRFDTSRFAVINGCLTAATKVVQASLACAHGTDSCVKSVSFCLSTYSMRRCSAESSTNTRMERYGYEAFGGISAVSTIAAMPTIEKKTHLCSIKYEVASLCLLAACTCWAHDRGRGSHSGHQAGVRERKKRSKVMLLLLSTTW